MSFIKKFLVLFVLSVFLSLGSHLEFPKAFAAQVENLGEDTEDELAAISFENAVDAKFNQVPDAVHESVHDHFLNNGSGKKFAYSKINGGKNDGNYVLSITSDAKNFQGIHLDSYIITPDGNMLRVKSAELTEKIKTLPYTERYSYKELASSAGKDNSYNGIRHRYNKALGNIANEVNAIGLQNITPEQAKIFYQQRREMGETLKTESGLVKYGIYARNLYKYGDKLGPTYDSFAKKGMSPAEIAVKAVTSGGKDMGLASSDNNKVVARLNSQLQILKEGKTNIVGTTEAAKNLPIKTTDKDRLAPTQTVVADSSTQVRGPYSG